MELPHLRSRLSRARVALGERKGQQQRLLQDRAACQANLERSRDDAEVFERVVVLLQQTSEHARRQAREQIELLVTKTLQAVFGEEYSFRIELTERAGRPEAEFYVLSRYGADTLETRPQEARGGGVVDVVALGLRVAMLETYRPHVEGPLLLDEPAKHVSEEYIQPASLFLKAVADLFQRQVIMVTHNQHLAETAEATYRVLLRDGVSAVTRST